MFFSFAFCTFFKIFHVRLGKKSKSVSFSRVYVCVNAILTLVSFFFTFFSMHLSLTVPWHILLSRTYLSTLLYPSFCRCGVEMTIKVSQFNGQWAINYIHIFGIPEIVICVKGTTAIYCFYCCGFA